MSSGGVEQLGRYLARHQTDSARILLYEAALRYGGQPDKVVTFGRIFLGDPRSVVSAPKIDLLEFLMRHPGLGLRELARALGRAPATVSEHLEELERAGLVLRESRGAGRPVSLRTLPQEIHIRLTSGEDEAAA